MKSIFSTLSFAFLLSISKAQNFIPLTGDPQGDNTMAYIADIKSVSYSMDLLQDSIWFQIETYNAMDPNGDVGLMLGFDTNMVSTDGLAWNGNNNSMHYDQSVIVFQDIMSPNYYGYNWNASGSNPYPVIVLRPDSFRFIVSFQISPIDADGNFNLLIGSGAFDIISNRTVYDDVPDNSFISISPLTATGELSKKHADELLYPNPASGFVCVPNAKENTVVSIFSASGKWIQNMNTDSKQRMRVSQLNPGIYFLHVNNEKEEQTYLFQKVN